MFDDDVYVTPDGKLRRVTKYATSGFNYRDSFDDFPTNANIGDIISKDGLAYVFCGNTWEPLGYPSKPQETNKSQKLTPKICTQCGAPLHSNKCEYCGTEFY